MRENRGFYWMSYINRSFSHLTMLCDSIIYIKLWGIACMCNEHHISVCYHFLVFKPVVRLFANHDLICLLKHTHRKKEEFGNTKCK